MSTARIMAASIATAALTFGIAGSASASAQARPAGVHWVDTGESFYWHSSCDAAGIAGENAGAWFDYGCNGSAAPWDSYELWVEED